MVKIRSIFTFGIFFAAVIPLTNARMQYKYINPSTPADQHVSTCNAVDERDVCFYNDLGDIVELDLMSQKECSSGEIDYDLDEHEQACVQHFQERPVIVRAVEEYKTRHGDEVNVKTRDHWELTFHEVQNSQLLSLETFRDLVNEHFMPKKQFRSFVDRWVLDYYNKVKLYVYRKVIASFARTTFVVRAVIDQERENINCSDIILDLDELSGNNKVQVQVEHKDLFNMHININPIT